MEFISCELCRKVFDGEQITVCSICQHKYCKDCQIISEGFCNYCNSKFLLDD